MKKLLFMAAILLPAWAWCQPGSVIRLANPSFEGTPGPGRLPEGWIDCGFERESPPDTQPGSFGVTRKAYDGETYLSMVVRAYGNYEAVGQRLGSNLWLNQCYRLKLMLARSNEFRSPTADNFRDTVDFITPAVLKVFGGIRFCDKMELLAETPPIDHFKWKEYELILRPNKNYNYLMFAVVCAGPGSYNGHILIDHLSDIEEIECDD